MKRMLACFVILFLIMVAADASARETGPVELTLHPAKAPKPMEKYQLLPKPDQQSDSDAVPLYEKAAQSLPRDLNTEQVRQWLDTPLKELPVNEVRSVLKALKPTLEVIEQASRCKNCKWPPVKPGTFPANQREYRTLAFSLALQARFQIAQGRYDKAIGTMQTGLTMARHLAEGTTLMQGMEATAFASFMLKQAEQLIQAHDAPNLYSALKSLPKPLIDLNKQMELEIANLKKYKNPLTRKKLQDILKPAHHRVRVLMKKLDRRIAALQCVEALRLYAAAHNGKFPNELSNITEVSIPDDPGTQKPFTYRLVGAQAFVEAPAPKGGRPEDAMQYKLTLKE